MSDLLIHGRVRDLGGFSVTRSIPTAQKRQLGPFVFLDHMGPFQVDESHAMDVRPHPHIGLATVTYLFSGRGYHRDSVGSQQIISPGDLNWMTSGRGIAHSERTPSEDRVVGQNMHGVQIWVGLPKEHEECEPSFVHWPKEKLPMVSVSENLKCKLLLGSFNGVQSPVQILSPTLFMDILGEESTEEGLSFDVQELGLFLVAGRGEINGQKLEVNDLLVVDDPRSVQLKLEPGARLVVIGGTPFPEPRYIWWNFVSSSKERIHQAAKDWENGKFGQVPGETEFIPLPKDPLP